MHALLLADDSDEMAILSFVLKRTGFSTTTGLNLREALNRWSEQPADVIVIALRNEDVLVLPDVVRQETEAPLVVITSAAGEDVHYQLLEKGADLVVHRPYSARLLMSQIRALIRRAGGVPIFSLPTLSLGGLTLDPSTRTVNVAGKRRPARLTHLEFRLLYTLMIHRGQILPGDIIVERVWGYSDRGSRTLVRGLISRLRGKVESDPKKPEYILTVPGIGYSFRDPTESG